VLSFSFFARSIIVRFESNYRSQVNVPPNLALAVFNLGFQSNIAEAKTLIKQLVNDIILQTLQSHSSALVNQLASIPVVGGQLSGYANNFSQQLPSMIEQKVDTALNNLTSNIPTNITISGDQIANALTSSSSSSSSLPSFASVRSSVSNAIDSSITSAKNSVNSSLAQGRELLNQNIAELKSQGLFIRSSPYHLFSLPSPSLHRSASLQPSQRFCSTAIRACSATVQSGLAIRQPAIHAGSCDGTASEAVFDADHDHANGC
jgi:hypothetical protein